MPERTDLESGDSVRGIIHRAGGAGEVENEIHRSAVKGLIDIDLLKFKAGFVAQVREVRKLSGQEIVGDNNGVALGQQGIAQMRAQETGSASHQGALRVHDFLSFLAEGVEAAAGTAGVPAGRPTL